MLLKCLLGSSIKIFYILLNMLCEHNIQHDTSHLLPRGQTGPRVMFCFFFTSKTNSVAGRVRECERIFSVNGESGGGLSTPPPP